MIRFLFAAVFLIAATAGYAEIVHASDGRILFGKILSAGSGTIEIESFGEKIVLPANDVLKTEKSLDSLKSLTVEIVLKDRSVLHGKIVEFDEDIGVFVDISFGTITVPIPAIQEINDVETKLKYEGSAGGVRSGVVVAVPSASSTYGIGTTIAVEGDWKTPWVRGLFLGGGVDYALLNYTANAQIKYSIVRLGASAEYRFFLSQSNSSWLSSLVPYVQASLGPAFILVDDNRPGIYPNRYSSVVPQIKVQTGVEIGPFWVLRARVSGTVNCEFQSSGLFLSYGAGMSLCYAF